MKTGIFITARLGSTRLQKKHLLPVNGHPILFFLIRRITAEFQKELASGEIKVIIVTPDEPENREFESFQQDGATVFYGSINNIPLRHLQAAKSHSLDSIISIDGDDILCSVRGMRYVHEALTDGACCYVKTSDLPLGMNSGGYSKAFLETALSGRTGDILETGWGQIFDEAKLVDIRIPFPVCGDLLRFTLDYREDYQLFKIIIEAFGDRVITARDEEIVKFVLDNKFDCITEPIAKKYWENFSRLQAQERKV